MGAAVRILHVDDDPGFLELAREHVERHREDFEVVTETDAEAALDRLDAGAFDCVVSDYRMPGVDGLAFLDAVRERSPELPFVLFTGEGSETVASEAITRGATDYLQKEPGTEQFELLANRIGNAVEGYRARRELREYRTLVETVGDAVYVLEPDGTVTIANETMAEMLNRDREEVVGTHARTFLADGDFERGTDLVVDILRDPDREWGTFEVTVQPRDGDPIPAEINVAPLIDDAGEYRATVGVVRDVTERKRRENRLGALHDTTRRLMDAEDFEAAAEIGIEAVEGVLDLELATFFEPEDDVLVPVASTDGVRDVVGEVPALRRGDSLAWRAFERGEPIYEGDVRENPAVSNPSTAIRTEMLVPVGGHGVFVVGSTAVDDFTQTDRELARVLAANLSRAIDGVERERELEEYERIVEAFPDEVYTLDSDGRFTSIVPPTGEATTVSGYDPDELVGEHVSTIMDPDDLERGELIVRELFTTEDRRKDSMEMDVVTKEGDRARVETHVALLPTEDARFQGTVGVIRDISERERRKRELERKNERLEEFVSVVSHDLRNPLNVATSGLHLARQDHDGEHLDDVAYALDRMEALIDDLLTLAREGEAATDAEPLDLGTVVRRCWETVDTNDVDATLAVETERTVRAAEGRLRQLLENLFRNAVEHGGDPVTVTVGGIVDGDAVEEDEDCAGFYVADDGPGIPESERDSVFESGYTTAADGTGFGLAIVEEIAQAHDWDLRVAESEAGGARFEVLTE